MSRNPNGNLVWVDAIGLMVAKRLTAHYGRLIVHIQSGPYDQHKPPSVKIVFNDPLVDFVNSNDTIDSDDEKSDDKGDFRFGYYIQRSYLKKLGERAVFVGFEVSNSILANRFFMKNIRADVHRIAMPLHSWLGSKGELSFLDFGLGVKKTYVWDLETSFDVLSENLMSYGNLGRKKKGVGSAAGSPHYELVMS